MLCLGLKSEQVIRKSEQVIICLSILFRDAIYKNRSILHLQKKVYINESLSKQNKRLFNSCLEYKKANRYKYIWTKNGKTFLKQGDESDVIVIGKERDLLQYNITDGVE